MITATLKNYRQAPRKVRLIANLIKGVSADKALMLLDNAHKRAGQPFKKLLLSAIANAKENHSLDIDKLFVQNATVDQGAILKRWRPRARGRASSIHKHTSHMTIVLSDISNTDKVSAKKDSVKEGKESKVETKAEKKEVKEKKDVKKKALAKNKEDNK